MNYISSVLVNPCFIFSEWQMEEASLLVDAIAQIDEPFLLAIVVIVC